jgi:protein-S-isoprenylcysteine O-methyltransferase Ste14
MLERDLTAMFGDDYRRYRDRVSMLIPFSVDPVLALIG